MTTPSIRPATPDDIPALIELFIAFHEFHVAGLPEWLVIPPTYDRAGIAATLAAHLTRADHALLVAARDGEPLGFIEVEEGREEADPARVARRFVWARSLFVTAAARQAGLGAALLAAARAWATARGANELRLSAWEFPAGPVAFYARRGFRTSKREMVWRWPAGE